MFYQAWLLAAGIIPPMKASRKHYQSLIKKVLIQISLDAGDLNYDPELPDSFHSLIIPVLIAKRVPKTDIMDIMNYAEALSQGSGNTGSGGVLNVPGVTGPVAQQLMEDGLITVDEGQMGGDTYWSTIQEANAALAAGNTQLWQQLMNQANGIATAWWNNGGLTNLFRP
jgi:hypothetical protein